MKLYELVTGNVLKEFDGPPSRNNQQHLQNFQQRFLPSSMRPALNPDLDAQPTMPPQPTRSPLGPPGPPPIPAPGTMRIPPYTPAAAPQPGEQEQRAQNFQQRFVPSMPANPEAPQQMVQGRNPIE